MTTTCSGPRTADHELAPRSTPSPTRGACGPRSSTGAASRVTRCGGRARRAGQPLPAPGRPAGRGVDREGAAALPVARLRLRPADRPPPAGLRRRAVPAFPVEERADGVVRRAARRRRAPAARVADVLVETLVALGRRRTSSAWSGTPTSGSPTRCAGPRSAARSRYIGIRHEGAAAFAASALRQAHRPAGGLLRDRRAGLDEPADRPVRRQARPGAGDRDLRPGALEGAGPRRVPGPRPVRGVPRRRRCPRSPCTPAATTPSWPRWPSSTRSTAAASRTWCCPTRCRCCPSDAPAGAPGRAGCADRPSRPSPTTLDAALRPARGPPAGR